MKFELDSRTEEIRHRPDNRYDLSQTPWTTESQLGGLQTYDVMSSLTFVILTFYGNYLITAGAG